MGKKNRMKHLIGRFNNEIGTEILDLLYSAEGTVREMNVKEDLNNDVALAICNVPYFLNENILKEVCTKAFDTPVASVQFASSTALHGDIKIGYRSGHINFASVQARRCAFDACKALKKPIELDNLGLKLPWHKVGHRRVVTKRRHCSIEEEHDKEAEVMETEKSDLNKPDEEGWVTVTKQHKFSFRGKINRIVPADQQMRTEEIQVTTAPKTEKTVEEQRNQGSGRTKKKRRKMA